MPDHVGLSSGDKTNKKQFPEVLVAPGQALGRKAIDLRIMDEPFFDVLPQFTIYNRFTMKKWLLNNCKDYVPVSIANLEVKIMAELQVEIDMLAVAYELERDTAIDERKSKDYAVLLTSILNFPPAVQSRGCQGRLYKSWILSLER